MEKLDSKGRRESSNGVGQPPKYIGHETDLWKVIGLAGKSDSGQLLYEAHCKSCGGIHSRNASQLGRNARSRDCPEYRSPNWSGLDREDRIMRRQYGISIHEFNQLLEFQDGGCAICRKPLSAMNRRMNIDHDHETNLVRGLLCTGCNTGLGYFGDDVEGLERAIYYLTNSPYSEMKDAR